jgi:hypothetical protein
MRKCLKKHYSLQIEAYNEGKEDGDLHVIHLRLYKLQYSVNGWFGVAHQTTPMGLARRFGASHMKRAVSYGEPNIPSFF